MPELLIRALARVVFRLLRYWILHRSDKYLARNLKLIRQIALSLTENEMVLNALTEMVEIFEEGGRNTELVRKMMRETTPEYAEAILRSIFRKD